MGCDLVERDEDEGALGEARVRDDETGAADDEIAVEQDVEVEGARAVGEAVGAVAAEVLFDEEQGAEQFEWGEIGFEGGGGVEKAGLVGESDGRGGVERGAGKRRGPGIRRRAAAAASVASGGPAGLGRLAPIPM